MAKVVTKTVLIASVALVPATPQNSGWIDVRAKYGCLVMAKYANGATGPTIGARFRVQVSGDANGVAAYDLIPGGETAPTTNSASGSFNSVVVPFCAAYIQITFDQNTAQNVTVQADLTTVDSV